VRDTEPTLPGVRAYRPPQCHGCLRPVTDHLPHCLAYGDPERIRREILARAHFGSLTKMQRALALACGAADKGAVLHWHGVLP
jgi:hypothetical protein